MLLSLGIASANFFAKLMLDDWLLTMDNMGMKTRVLRAPCWWMMMMTFNGLRVVIPLSWYAEQSPGVTRTCPVLFSTQPVRLSIEPGIIIDKGSRILGCRTKKGKCNQHVWNISSSSCLSSLVALVTASFVQWIYCSTKKYKKPPLFHSRDPTKRGRERVVHAQRSDL